MFAQQLAILIMRLSATLSWIKFWLFMKPAFCGLMLHTYTGYYWSAAIIAKSYGTYELLPKSASTDVFKFIEKHYNLVNLVFIGLPLLGEKENAFSGVPSAISILSNYFYQIYFI